MKMDRFEDLEIEITRVIAAIVDWFGLNSYTVKWLNGYGVMLLSSYQVMMFQQIYCLLQQPTVGWIGLNGYEVTCAERSRSMGYDFPTKLLQTATAYC